MSELKHCVEHKNGRNMELMSFTEEEPWWVLHWASLLPAEEWGLNLFSHLLTTNMTFLNPLAQKSHVVKGIAAAGRYTMGQMRAGELCGLRTPLGPGFASCRLHGARPRCPRPAPPRCARLFLWAQLAGLCPKHQVLAGKPNRRKVSRTFCGWEAPRGPSWRLLVKCVFCLLRPSSRV